MAPSTTSTALHHQPLLNISPRLEHSKPLKLVPALDVGMFCEPGWSCVDSLVGSSVQLERLQPITSHPGARYNITVRSRAALCWVKSAGGICLSPGFAKTKCDALPRRAFCEAKATGPVTYSRRDATKVFYRPVRMPASKETANERDDGSGGARTAEIAPLVTSTGADDGGGGAQVAEIAPPGISTNADETAPLVENVAVDDSASQSDTHAEVQESDNLATTSSTNQTRRVRESSPWWKKNFSSVKRPRLEPDSEASSLIDTHLESTDSETNGDDAGVKQPTSDLETFSSRESSGYFSDEDEDLVARRNRGKKGRVTVKYGKGKAVLRSNETRVSCENERMQRSVNGAWFPHSGLFEFDGVEVDAAYVKRALQSELAQNRLDRISEVVAGRSYAVVPVVEGLANLANVSAVCRTAEALGCQSVHAIAREKARYKASGRVSAGSDKWLDLELWTDTRQCLRTLKKRGYRIAVTCMDQLGGGGETRPIHEIDWTIPTAVVLGNEMFGVTGEAKEFADIGCYIPMGGFTDSFNIAHAAAILMYHAVRDRIERQGFHADLTSEQRDILTAEFYLRTNRTAESVVHRLLELEGAVLRKAPKGFVRSLVEAQGESSLIKEE